MHIDFEVIWTFLQGATWILNPSGTVPCNVGKEQGKTPKFIFVERSGVARSVRDRKLIAKTVMEF